MVKWKVTYDNGKPWEEEYNSDAELKAGLKKFYISGQTGDFASMDAFVYNDKGEDFTDSQFVDEIVAEIQDEVDNEKEVKKQKVQRAVKTQPHFVAKRGQAGWFRDSRGHSQAAMKGHRRR